MKRVLKLSIFLAEILLFLGIVFFGWRFECLFKRFIGLRCPGCGLTRAFFALMSFDIKSALKYNFLSLPLFLFIINLNRFIIADIIFLSEKTEKFLAGFKGILPTIIGAIVLAFVINNIGQI